MSVEASALYEAVEAEPANGKRGLGYPLKVDLFADASRVPSSSNRGARSG